MSNNGRASTFPGFGTVTALLCCGLVIGLLHSISAISASFPGFCWSWLSASGLAPDHSVMVRQSTSLIDHSHQMPYGYKDFYVARHNEGGYGNLFSLVLVHKRYVSSTMSQVECSPRTGLRECWAFRSLLNSACITEFRPKMESRHPASSPRRSGTRDRPCT